MIKHQFGLFDFLTFFLTGGTLVISVILVFIVNANLTMLLASNLSMVLIIPFVLASYWVGHIINILGRYLEKELFGKKNVWLDVFNAHVLREDLKEVAVKEFNCDNDKIRAHDPIELGNFYDKGYYKLELNGNLAKPQILMSQYTFFRACAALGTIYFLPLIIVILFMVFADGKSTLAMFSTALFLLAFIIGSVYMMRARKKEHMKNIYSLIAISK